MPDSGVLLDGVPATKLKHIADMASTLDAGDMKDFVPAKPAYLHPGADSANAHQRPRRYR